MTNKNYHQGIFEPTNKEKYKGDKTPVFRSSWELKFMRLCDINENIIGWGSESLKIPYFSPIDQKVHNYYPDFVIQVKKPDGSKKMQIIEIKPSRETKPPKIAKNRNSKTMMYESLTYVKNQAKWKAAKAFCAERDWEFIIVTEKDL
jgi:hypothetical protein